MKAYTPEELDRMVKGAMTSESNICQVLGKALGYPAIYVADGPEGEYIVAPDHPGARPTQDVCVGEHVAETLADEAANRLMLAESYLLAVATMLKIDPSNDLPLGDEVIIAVRNLVELCNELRSIANRIPRFADGAPAFYGMAATHSDFVGKVGQVEYGLDDDNPCVLFFLGNDNIVCKPVNECMPVPK